MVDIVLPTALQVSTHDAFYSNISDQTLRLYVLFAMMEKKGNFIANAGDATHSWPCYVRENTVGPLVSGTPLRFVEHNGYERFTVGRRNCIATDALGHEVMAANQGYGQIYDITKEKTVRLAQAVQHRMASSPYEDGTTITNFEGMDTFKKYTACTSADMIATPNGTYATKATNLGDQPSTWSTSLPTAARPNATLANDYPFGNGQSQYDYNSPKFLNTETTRYRSGKTGFGINSEEILSNALLWTRHNTGQMAPDVLFAMSSDHFAEFRDNQSAKLRTLQPHMEAERLGFGSVFNFEGSMLYPDSACPAGSTRAIDFSKSSFFHYGPKLIQHEDQVWVTEAHAYIWKAFIYGNFRWNTKHVSFIGNFTA